MGKQIRNTRTERLCPHCLGDGSVTKNDSAIGDPQQEYDVRCGYEGCDDGWIRFAPMDPLEHLKQARQQARASWGAHYYGRLRQRAVSPVCLPRDRIGAEDVRWAA